LIAGVSSIALRPRQSSYIGLFIVTLEISSVIFIWFSSLPSLGLNRPGFSNISTGTGLGLPNREHGPCENLPDALPHPHDSSSASPLADAGRRNAVWVTV